MNLLSSISDQNEVKRTRHTLLPKTIKKKKNSETAVVKTLDIGAEMENKGDEHSAPTYFFEGVSRKW